MGLSLKPLADRVVVEPAPAEDKSAGGIILPDTAQEKPPAARLANHGGENVSPPPGPVSVTEKPEPKPVLSYPENHIKLSNVLLKFPSLKETQHVRVERIHGDRHVARPVRVHMRLDLQIGEQVKKSRRLFVAEDDQFVE